MSQLVQKSRKAAHLLKARAPRDRLTPQERRDAYKFASLASISAKTEREANLWRQAALNMIPFDD